MNARTLWDRYRRYACRCEPVGMTLDISRMRFSDAFLDTMSDAMKEAFDAMQALEGGAIANPDEKRMVGHYWLRAPQLAPSPEIRDAIETTLRDVKSFARDVHSGAIHPEVGDRFVRGLVIGIGGSVLGPQFVADALGGPGDRMPVSFVDNTDPDGIDRTLAKIGESLPQTLTLVITKSGRTAETRNAMLEVMQAYARRDRCFSDHAVAVTQPDSEMDRLARSQNWLRSFPMWDWIGGRTSQTSAVGLLPAGLQGIDVDAFLAGAREMDEITRSREAAANPAALLALMWYHAGEGRGAKNMVVIPYKDRLALFSRYLQQLVMESLGKEQDLDGNVVHQGLTVYGNKGSTDQHAFVQQLRDGRADFFAVLVEVLRDRQGPSIHVEGDTTSGDYLMGFLHGTREALYAKSRESITLTLDEISPRSVGALIALFERAVGLYASLIHVNAYHQPGVEAGKTAAARILDLQRQVLRDLHLRRGERLTAEQISDAVGAGDDVELVCKILEHLSANPDRGIVKTPGPTAFDATYAAE